MSRACTPTFRDLCPRNRHPSLNLEEPPGPGNTRLPPLTPVTCGDAKDCPARDRHARTSALRLSEVCPPDWHGSLSIRADAARDPRPTVRSTVQVQIPGHARGSRPEPGISPRTAYVTRHLTGVRRWKDSPTEDTPEHANEACRLFVIQRGLVRLA